MPYDYSKFRKALSYSDKVFIGSVLAAFFVPPLLIILGG